MLDAILLAAPATSLLGAETSGAGEAVNSSQAARPMDRYVNATKAQLKAMPQFKYN